MKLIEAAGNHPYRTTAITGLLLGTLATEIIGYANNPTYNAPEKSCVSPPPAVSETYVSHNTSTLLQTYTGLFTTGVVARGSLPSGAYGVEASFKSPDADAHTWDENASNMLKANSAGRFALKMAIGSGEVQFGVRIVAPEGSPLCSVVPDVTYTHEDRTGYFTTPGTLPWPNPVAIPVNVLSNA